MGLDALRHLPALSDRAAEVDVNTVPRVAAEFAGLLPDARLVVQPGAGHYPWLDGPGLFTSAVAAFLDDGR